jgi:hypothetical protein
MGALPMAACVTEMLFHSRQPAPPLDLFVQSILPIASVSACAGEGARFLGESSDG